MLTGHTLKDSEYTIQFHRGELFPEGAHEGLTAAERMEMSRLRREPLILEPEVDKVLSALDRIAGFASQPA